MYIALAVIVVLIAALLAFVATWPVAFRIERTAAIPAPPGKTSTTGLPGRHGRSWIRNLRRTYSGTESGKGAMYEWRSNSKAGQGAWK
jgi:hypothetical protein